MLNLFNAIRNCTYQCARCKRKNRCAHIVLYVGLCEIVTYGTLEVLLDICFFLQLIGNSFLHDRCLLIRKKVSVGV